MRTRDRARIEAFRHAMEQPLLLDLLLAVVLSWAVTKKATADGQVVAADIAVAALAFVAVLLRRVRPLLAVGIVTAAAIGAVWHGVRNPGLLVAIGVIIYSVAAHTNRRQGWICALVSSGALYFTGVLVAAQTWWRFDTLGVFAWIFLAAAAGDAARSHRAFVAEVEERARRAEQTREDEARRRVVEERLRIARELHDVVAHHIAVISVQAGAAAHLLERRPDQVGPSLRHIREASETVLREIQSVVGVLRNADEAEGTEPAPGLAQLPELLAGLTAASFRVRHQERGPARRLPLLVDLAAYRIVQEALTNAHRYGTGGATLVVEYTAAGVVVDIGNEIRPFRERAGTGYGLLGIRERAASAGGEVTAGPAGDGRFRVHAVLPAPAPAPMASPTAGDVRRSGAVQRTEPA